MKINLGHARRLGLSLASFLPLVLLSAAWGQTDTAAVSLSPRKAERGQQIDITIVNPPNVNRGVVRLDGEGGHAEIEVDSLSSIHISLPLDLQLGLYQVKVIAGGRVYVAGMLDVVSPSGQPLKLAPFVPAHTYDRQADWVPDLSNRPVAKELNTVRVILRGGGFAVSRPGENEILLNGQRQKIIWDGCAHLPASNTSHPVANVIHGTIVSAAAIELCRVPESVAGAISVRHGSAIISISETEMIARETVWIPEYRLKKLPVMRLTLYGSGFLTERPDDNRILLGNDLTPVVWDGCAVSPGSGASSNASPGVVHGEVLNSGRIDLCNIPIPESGRLLVAVRQGSKTSETQGLSVFGWSRWPVAVASGLTAILLGLLVLALVSARRKSASSKKAYNVLQSLFLDPETTTYSLSKFQFYCWTVAALFGYAYLVIGRMLVQQLGWPDIPGTLPGIVAIGAGTSIASQFVTNVRGPKGSGVESPNMSDLVSSGGVVAADRVQMFVWTVFGVIVFLLSVVQQGPGTITGLSPVPDGMLYMMGLSSLGYLGGKLARKPGPVIAEVSVTPSECEEAFAALPPAPPPPDLAQPVAAAETTLQKLKSALAALSAPAKAESAIAALASAVATTTKTKSAANAALLPASLSALRLAAEAAATEAAQEFQMPGATADAARAAELAQQAAAALQTLAESVSQAVAASPAPSPDRQERTLTARIMELRGRNLSVDALIEIDGVPLPFGMLKNKDGKNAPDVIARDDEAPALARVLRLSFTPPFRSADSDQYCKWFGKGGQRVLSIINPDGQKSDITFTVSPSAASKPGVAAEAVAGGNA